MINIPVLETKRLILRGHTPDDLEACQRIWCQEEVYRHTIGKPSSLGDAWGRILKFSGLWQHLGYGYWVVEDKQTGNIVGDFGFGDFKRSLLPSVSGMPEAGWILGREYHGQGLAFEACEAMLEWVDQTNDSPQICCIIHPDNAPSIKLAERLGFNPPIKGVMDGHPELIFYRDRRTRD